MNFFGNRDKDKDRPDLNAELETHLQMSAQDHVARGADCKSATEAAHRELGNVPLIQQTARDQRPIAAFFDNLLQDIRFALRTLRKNPPSPSSPSSPSPSASAPTPPSSASSMPSSSILCRSKTPTASSISPATAPPSTSSTCTCRSPTSTTRAPPQKLSPTSPPIPSPPKK